MQQAESPSRRLRFGVFEADPRTGALTKRGRRLRLQEQPFRLLVMLLERPGELVTREELRSRLWPDTTVDFDHGLNKAISKIRDALGDSADNPRFIETVARRGYRLLVEVTQVCEAPSGSAAAHSLGVGESSPGPPIEADGRRPGRRPGAWILAALGAALVVAALALWSLRAFRPADAPIRSLAVLPLANFSGDASQDYLADGMTDELIARLGQIGALRVISRTSAMTYRGVREPLPKVARALNVDAVVEGSVVRSGDQVRINVELIRAPTDTRIWGQSYSGDLRDTLALQDGVARDIAEQIRSNLNLREQAALKTSTAVVPEALEDYLKGRNALDKRTSDGLEAAIGYFSQATKADPTFAEAYAGQAEAYALAGDWGYAIIPPSVAFAQAKAAAMRALVLNDRLAEAHTALAFTLDLYAWDWKGAEKQFIRAIELRPSDTTAHLWYAWHLIETGRNGQGIAELRKAESLDPLSLIVSANLADGLCVDHQFQASVRQSQRTLEIDPHFAVAHFELGRAYAQERRYEEAIGQFKRAIELAGHLGAFDANLAYVYALAGRTAEARRILTDLEGRQAQNPSAAGGIALVYVGLRDHDAAMAWLNKAYEAHFNPSELTRPAWDPLRSDPRFKDLLHRIGLPE